MKSLFIYSFLLIGFIIYNSTSQSFINGDFEENISEKCDYNLSDEIFNTKISNVVAFGKGFTSSGFVGEIDILTIDCYVIPQNGEWCIGLSSDSASTSDAVTLELTSHLETGNKYELIFYIYGNSIFQKTLANIEIGESISSSTFGEFIGSFTPDSNVWKKISYTFTASQNSNFISVRTKSKINGWTQIDNFSIGPKDDGINNLSSLLYPNPTNNSVALKFNKLISSGQFILFNLTGQLLIKNQIYNAKELEIDLTGIASGVYFIRIESEEGNELLKLVKL